MHWAMQSMYSTWRLGTKDSGAERNINKINLAVRE